MEKFQTGFLSKGFSVKVFLFSNLVISFGILLVTVGGGWDISNHLLNKPETFFSPPHGLLYSGVAIALFGTMWMISRWIRLSPHEKSRYRFSVKLGIVGIAILVLAGPIDFAWHSNFGLDGLLSPPHQILITGVFLCSVGSMISIIRFGNRYKKESYSLHHFLVVLALLPVWLVSSGFLYSFSLPFSKTTYFDFNPDIYFAAIFATIAMPFVVSTILALSSKFSNHKFGILSVVGAILLAINIGNSIVPNSALIDTIPFYLMTMLPFVVSDAIMAISKNHKISLAAGAILGSTFYFVYYPLITHIYNKVIDNAIVSGSLTSHVYFQMLPTVYPLVILPSIIMGILGLKFSEKIFAKI